MRRLWSSAAPLLGNAAAGLLTALPFLDGRLFFCAYPGLILFLALRFRDGGRRFGRCYLFAYCFHLPLYSFFVNLYPFEGFGMTRGVAVFVVLLAVFAIPAVHALFFSAVFTMLRFVRRRALLPLCAGALWVIFEWTLSFGTLAFPWGTLAAGQYLFLPAIQSASLLGSYFVTLVIVTGCGYLALFARQPEKKAALAAGSALLAGNLALGCILLALPVSETETIRAAVVQGNIGTSEKWESGRAEEILSLYASLTEQAAAAGAELILLPESAVPIYFDENGVLYRTYARIAAEYGCTIATGVLVREGEVGRNAFLAVYPDGSISERYDKRHLVPFGEYLPFESLLKTLLPFLEDLNLGSTQFVAGEDSTVVPLCGIETGALICYDSIFPPLAAESIRSGAKLLAVVTNDSWFGDSAALSQHMSHSVLRAVENGVCVVRAANTGISCIIGPKGELRAQTAPETVAVAYADVGAAAHRTLYSYIGDVILHLSFAVVLAILLWSYIEKRTEKKHDRDPIAQQAGV